FANVSPGGSAGGDNGSHGRVRPDGLSVQPAARIPPRVPHSGTGETAARATASSSWGGRCEAAAAHADTAVTGNDRSCVMIRKASCQRCTGMFATTEADGGLLECPYCHARFRYRDGEEPHSSFGLRWLGATFLIGAMYLGTVGTMAALVSFIQLATAPE